MKEPKLDLEISIDLGNETDPQLTSQLTRQLHQDIVRIGVDSVTRPTDDEIIEVAKGFPLDINTLLVTLTSASVVVALIQLLQAWVLRAEGRKIKIRVEDKAVEFEYSPTAVSEKDLMAFAKRLQQFLKKK